MKRLVAPLAILLMLGLMFGCGKKKTESELLSEISQLVEKEEFSQAVKVLEEFVSRFPESPKVAEMMNKLATLYASSEKNFTRAIDTYRDIIKKYPDSRYVAQAQFMIGYIYANELKDYDMAEVEYKKFLEKYPQHELASSVKWELEHLGQDINEIDLFMRSDDNSKDTPRGSAKK
ncbi:MAG: tetratricopeptide repeat protein [candidate division KSB1 bacterium]|nr:tetratricopeptide repeat protein [candidate division KSB1 bacterium]